MDILLGLLTLPLYALVLWPLVVASRRVLGVRIGAVRALCGAGFGWLVASGIGQAFPVSLRHNGPAAIGLLIPLAGSAFLATLIFLFVAEMALPGGL
ncbi:MAG TPA: AarF/ABC1/UbiB kinase family protein, partial [Streptomyces sp.]